MNRDVFAVLTPAGTSALAVVGMQGPSVWSKLSPFFVPIGKNKPKLLKTKSGSTEQKLWLGRLQKDGVGDQVVLSLSGSDQKQLIEIQTHGGPAVIDWIHSLANVLDIEGIDSCDWLKLNQPAIRAEAETALSQARTPRAAAILLDQYWKLEDEFQAIRTDLSHPEKRELSLSRIHSLLQWDTLGQRLVSGWKVVIAGPVNAGKSTLLNAIIGYSRSITSPTPGTTRDAIRAVTSLDGYLFEFWDTAGQRETVDSLESLGIEKAKNHVRDADLVIWVEECVPGQTVKFPDHLPGNTLRVLNKGDLAKDQPASSSVLRISAKSGEGIPELLQQIKARLIPHDPKPGQLIPFLPSHAQQLKTWENQLLHSGTIKMHDTSSAPVGRMSA